MPKTFKNVPALPEAGAAVKPVSERDFFDLTDQPAPAAGQLPVGNTGNTGNTSAPLAAPDRSSETDPVTVRQTFVLSRGQLEQLRDYVHARRAQGDLYYSQKQALQEALALLFAAAAPAPPRPAQAREREQLHRSRIRQGRPPGR